MVDGEIQSGYVRDCVNPSSGDYSWLCIQSSEMTVIRDDRSGTRRHTTIRTLVEPNYVHEIETTNATSQLQVSEQAFWDGRPKEPVMSIR